jgi:hypothetical protein
MHRGDRHRTMLVIANHTPESGTFGVDSDNLSGHYSWAYPMPLITLSGIGAEKLYNNGPATATQGRIRRAIPLAGQMHYLLIY